MLRSVNELLGYGVEAKDGRIGAVRDILFNQHGWCVCHVMIDLTDLIPGKRVVLPPDSFSQPDAKDFSFPVNISCEELKNGPTLEIDETEYRKHADELCHHFGWEPCWRCPSVGPEWEQDRDLEEDMQMRSSREVMSYGIEATDGSIGHVWDLILDVSEWIIRYVVVHTRNWLPGRKVLIAPSWITRIEWDELKVYVSHTRQAIKEGPVFDPSEPVNRKFEEVLYDYYGRPKYWDE
jgi:uncharacterized protein YrrD